MDVACFKNVVKCFDRGAVTLGTVLRYKSLIHFDKIIKPEEIFLLKV